MLRAEGVHAGRRGILKFLTRYEREDSVSLGSGRTIITQEIKEIVEENIRADDKSTAMQLQQLLISQLIVYATSHKMR